MTAPTIEDVAKTLAEYEALAIGTGDRVQLDPPEFTDGVSVWAFLWLATDPPKGARVTVHRNDVPTTVYVSWDESLPADDEWRALWLRKPMKLFGAYTLRTAIRRAFREVVGDRREPDEETGDPWAALPEPRDWPLEMGVAADEAEVLALHAEAKRARAVTPPLELAFRARLAEVRARTFGGGTGTTTAAAARVALDIAPELSPDELAKHRAFFDQPEVARYEWHAPQPAPTPATIPHTPKPAETRRPRRAQSHPAETAVSTALRDAVLRVTKGDDA